MPLGRKKHIMAEGTSTAQLQCGQAMPSRINSINIQFGENGYVITRNHIGLNQSPIVAKDFDELVTEIKKIDINRNLPQV